MAQTLYFDDLDVGDSWQSPRRTITHEEVFQFAELTGDFNPLHLDEEFAKETPFRQPIAHGLLGLSYVAGLGSQDPLLETVAFLGIRDWKFLQPIYFGDEVHVVSEVAELASVGRKRGRVLLKRSLLNQDGLLVQQGHFETLVARRSIVRPRRVVVSSSAPALSR